MTNIKGILNIISASHGKKICPTKDSHQQIFSMSIRSLIFISAYVSDLGIIGLKDLGLSNYRLSQIHKDDPFPTSQYKPRIKTSLALMMLCMVRLSLVRSEASKILLLEKYLARNRRAAREFTSLSNLHSCFDGRASINASIYLKNPTAHHPFACKAAPIQPNEFCALPCYDPTKTDLSKTRRYGKAPSGVWICS